MATACRSCGRPVMWVETLASAKRPGRKMPLDADPQTPDRAQVVPGGNIVFTGNRTGDGTPIVRYVKGGRHVSHFATCKQADSWRKK